MTDQEFNEMMAQLNESHKKAMEGINAFNKEMKGVIETTKDYIGYPKDK